MINNHSREKLTSDISSFVIERDRGRFHSPKNVAMALSIEVASPTLRCRTDRRRKQEDAANRGKNLSMATEAQLRRQAGRRDGDQGDSLSFENGTMRMKKRETRG